MTLTINEEVSPANKIGALGPIIYALLIVWIYAAAVALFGAPVALSLLVVFVLLASTSAELTISLIVVFIVFQNITLSIFADQIENSNTLSMAQGANYIIFVTVFAKIMIFNQKLLNKKNVFYILGVGVLLIYFVIGAARGQLVGAAAYFRLFSIPLIALFISLHYSSRVSTRFVRSMLVALAVCVLCFVVAEFFLGADYYAFVNATKFNLLKRPEEYALIDLQSFVDASQRSFLNLTGDFRFDLRVPTIYGPSVHPISTAYILATLGIAMWFLGKKGLFTSCLIALVLVNAKGPLALLVVPVIANLSWKLGLFRRSAPFYLVALYAFAVVAYGLYTNDIHIWGLFAGIRSLATSPWGQGLGEGGNLSSSILSMRALGRLNTRTLPFPVESAIGVMFYQVGVLSIVLCWFVWQRLRRSIDATSPYIKAYLSTFVSMMFVNGAFQEEAFAPAAVGLGLIVALLLSRAQVDEFAKLPKAFSGSEAGLSGKDSRSSAIQDRPL